MKIYDYECKRCKFRLEDYYIYSDDELVTCTICHKPMDKLPSAPIFKLKGDCWEKDGYTKKL